MDRLHELLREKVRREQLSTNVPDRAPTGKTCWLCGCDARLRYRLKDRSSLCFACFRTAYIALVLPFIDSPARRKSDVAVLKEIERVSAERRAKSSHEALLSQSPLVKSSSMFDPLQASFVMSASVMRQQRLRTGRDGDRNSSSSSTQNTKSGGGGAGAQAQQQLWNCPHCTFVNPVSAMRCEACGFTNSTTVKCPHCGTLCPVDATNTTTTDGGKGKRSSHCSNGKPHVVWCCRECGGLNTLDGDQCELCKRSRYWACTYCTALHNVSRTQEGLRYCSVCGSYNTPEDVQNGQDKIDAEKNKAKMFAQHEAQKGVVVHGAHGATVSTGNVSSGVGTTVTIGAGGGGDAGSIVFGVNDAQTLAEKERQREIEANTQRLNRRLDALHIRRISQKSDGNCLFSALAHQLFGNENLQYLVRSCVTAYMRENANDYRILFDGPEEWTQYLSQMKENGNWGDELCINAASRCFCVNIHVITSDPERWHIAFQHDELGRSETNLRDKLPLPADEFSLSASPHSLSTTRTGRTNTATGRADSSSKTLSLFLAYLYPVHFDDVTPSDVPAVVLSDLMVPELHKMLGNEGGTPASGSADAPRPAPLYDLNLDGSTRRHHSKADPSSAALYSEQRQERHGSALSTSPTVVRPAVPRARGPNSTPPGSGSLSHSGSLGSFSQPHQPQHQQQTQQTQQQQQPPPPSHRPGSFRSTQSSSGSYR